MKFAKVENNVVVQMQPSSQSGFVEVADSVIVGFVKNGEDFDPPVIAFNLALAQAVKRTGISDAFDAAFAPVPSEGFLWHPGIESAQRLDGAMRLNEKAGQTTVKFFDVDNIGHILTFSEADTVILAVGVDYQTKFGIKKGFMVDIDSATTQAELDAIVW